MVTIDDGGPAFPQPLIRTEDRDGYVQYVTAEDVDCGGMRLLDFFAAKAMVEALRHERDIRSSMIAPGDFRYDAVAHAAYVMADAMLRARRAGQE